jgi:multiple antibiotic resistance protein
MSLWEQPLLLFLALLGLYSPVAALPSYFGVVGQLTPGATRRLAVALFVNTALFALVALWIGEPLLELIGLTTAALTATGGIALMYEGVALMRGTAHDPEADDGGQQPAEVTAQARAAVGAGEATPVPPGTAPTVGIGPADGPDEKSDDWRRFAFVPVTFPLTVGGTTFAFFVAFRAEAHGTSQVVLLSVAGLGYAAVTALTVYLSGHVQRRARASTAALLDRLAGILLTAIAVTILISGVTRLVVDFLPT